MRRLDQKKMIKKTAVIHFGCSKNLVESESLLGIFAHSSRYELTGNVAKADIIIFNSCGFLSSARQEVRQKIQETKRINPRACCILYGCLARLFRTTDEQWRECARFEKLFHYQVQNTRELASLLENISEKPPARYHQTSPSYTYLKLSDGCSNFCSYCLIPFIRGPYKSRSRSKIVREARHLIFEKEYRELNCISQDTAMYGKDRGDSMTGLLEELTQWKGKYWLRCLYMHPAHITQSLIDMIATHPKIASYMDIPLQHISTPILRKMNRGLTKKRIYRLFEMIREKYPELMIRTTFMVGYPGETEEDFQEIYDFMEYFSPIYAGFFTYSPERFTPAYKYRKECPPFHVSRERIAELWHLQTRLLRNFHRSFIGKELNVLIDKEGRGIRPLSVGRAYFQAPEVDSVIQVLYNHSPGSVIRVKITSADAWKLSGYCVDNKHKHTKGGALYDRLA